MNKIVDRFQRDGADVLSDGDIGILNLVTKATEAAKERETVFVIGHAVRDHESGATLLVLPDGSRVAPSALVARVPSANLIFVSCFSRDLDPASAITLEARRLLPRARWAR